jgi:hypothetical protein
MHTTSVSFTLRPLTDVWHIHRIQDSGMRDQITSGLTYMQDLGTGKYALFFLGWLISKSLCLDFLSVFLALASGVLFGGVLEGTAASTICVSLYTYIC